MSVALLEDEAALGSEGLTEDEQQRIDVAASKVRMTYRGLRVSVSGIPSRRVVTETQRAEAADAFGADASSVSVSTLLWNAKEPQVKNLRQVVSGISRLFTDRTKTLPTTTPGLRMVRRNAVADLHTALLAAQADLHDKAVALRDALPVIVERERKRRGRLFNADDYAFDPVRCVQLTWSFPSVTEDNDLAEIDDSVYQHEIQRIRDEFRDVVRRAESQMAEELVTMLDHIVSRLATDSEDGGPLVFRDNTVARLFTEMSYLENSLRETGIGGDIMQEALTKLRDTLHGQNSQSLPAALRSSGDYREQVRQNLAALADSVMTQAIPEPRRRILRKKK